MALSELTAEGARVEIGPLPDRARPVAAMLLARAFRDNPLNRAVIGRGEARRLRSNGHAMRASLSRREILVLRLSLLQGHESISGDSSDALAALLLVLPPGGFPLLPSPLGAQLRAVVGQGLRTASRWGEVYRALQIVHPQTPHWYLSLLGVDPAYQRRGYGRALLEHWLAEVDREPAPCYLETDRAENVDFYAAAGFSLRTELQVLGTPIYTLWREVISPQSESETH